MAFETIQDIRDENARLKKRLAIADELMEKWLNNYCTLAKTHPLMQTGISQLAIKRLPGSSKGGQATAAKWRAIREQQQREKEYGTDQADQKDL